MDRPWIEAGLKTAVVQADDLPALLVQRVARIRGSSTLDQRFLRVVVGTQEFTEYLVGTQTGTTIPHISARQIGDFTFRLPPIADQRAIGAFVGVLDDKIELNRRLCLTLEELAESVFRARFVDFEDAEGLVESKVGWIPRNWRPTTVGEIASRVRGAVQPRSRPGELFEHFSIPAFDGFRRPDRVSGSTILSGKTPLTGEAVLISKLNPATPRVWWARPGGVGHAVCSGEFVALEPSGGTPISYLYAAARHDPGFSDHVLAHVSGTTGSRQRVRPDDILSAPIAWPGDEYVREFAAFADPLYELVHTLEAESDTLVALRDTVLPTLVSGEVRLRDLKEAVG